MKPRDYTGPKLRCPWSQQLAPSGGGDATVKLQPNVGKVWVIKNLLTYHNDAGGNRWLTLKYTDSKDQLTVNAGQVASGTKLGVYCAGTTTQPAGLLNDIYSTNTFYFSCLCSSLGDTKTVYLQAIVIEYDENDPKQPLYNG